MTTIIDLGISFLLLLSGGFALLGSLGLVRLQTFYQRLHGPTKATTLGVGCALIASSLWFSTRGAGLSVHELLVTVFLVLTAPVSAHLLVRAARHLEQGDGPRPPDPGAAP
jgi:multicomponent K+:H+ antiporter subunit G